VTAIESRLDIVTLATSAADELGVNEIGRVVVETQDSVPVSPYRHHRAAGAAIVVDPATHRTSGALLMEGAQNSSSL
jgi:sulfate adenylyltransferase subunit 1